MSPDFPQRPESHQLADESERFFRLHLPREWTCEAPKDDYGVDLRLGLVSDGRVSGKEIVVQLKSSEEDGPGETVAVRLKTSTYNYLREMLPVALLVKYVAAEREAYWLLWERIHPPPSGQDTFVVRIPRRNRLSENPWPAIEKHVVSVHDDKLAFRDQRQALPHLNQTPSTPLDFQGRAGEIKELVKHLQANRDGGIWAVRGLGGIGKSTLAAVVAQRAADQFPDGVLWLDLKGSRPHVSLSSEAAIARVLHSFDPMSKLPTDVAALKAQYLSTLRNKRCLIVFDDARNVDQVRALAPPPHVAVLLTSRLSFQMPGMRSFELPAMPMPEAAAFMREILSDRKPPISDRDAENIAQLCQRLPLALRAAASFLAENHDWKVSAYIDALTRSRLNTLHTEDPELDVRTVLGFSHAQLIEQQVELARYWRLLAIIPSHFDLAAAAAVWGCTADVAQDALSALRRRAMLEYDEIGERYRFHDLMRDLAEEEFRKRGESLDV